MTPNEALGNIKRGKCFPYKKATISQIAKLCEKQIPKKPLEQEEVLYVMTGKCPCCGSDVNAMTNENYCQQQGCGQALDWSDTE